jgi:ribosomal protein L10
MEQGTEEVVDAEVVEEAEVAQLPVNPEMLTARMDELREEIGQITNVINANQKQLDTHMAAFNWYAQQLEAVTPEQE